MTRPKAKARAFVLAFTCVGFISCGDAEPERAHIVEPIYADACDELDCSGLGECLTLDGGAPYCACTRGYAGRRCDTCEAGFHRDAYWHCVPDRSCEDEREDPCGGHGECKDDDGVIACDCEPAYQGARCHLCSAGYRLDEKGTCLRKGSS